MTDIEIAQNTILKPIKDIARGLGIEDNIVLYGDYKAKIRFNEVDQGKQGKLILITAMHPTPLGEGKTTVTIGLADALSQLGHKTVVALREPSMGPVFGMKGCATGGGYAQVVPMEDINLHFTGDMHAIGYAHNFISAYIENHRFHGNELDIESITWGRVVDINDRSLRNITINGKNTHDSYFDITVASEIMAILCLSKDELDLKERLNKIVIGYNSKSEPIYVKDLDIEDTLMIILKDAINPNLVQTLEGTPAIIHGGPFANIAHGCNSIIATHLGLQLSDYTVTEAGFGSDLGAEKFLNIKTDILGKMPDSIGVVITIRAIKYLGQTLESGFKNVLRHYNNMNNVFKIPTVLILNKYYQDTKEEVAWLQKECSDRNINFVISESWEKGGKGAIEVAEMMTTLCDIPNTGTKAYDLEDPFLVKLDKIISKIYGGKGYELEPKALKQLEHIQKYQHYPICIAKTQYSFSDNPELLNNPSNFTITVKDIEVKNGAGFIVVKTGKILTMPGLPKVPKSKQIKFVDGKILGLD